VHKKNNEKLKKPLKKQERVKVEKRWQGLVNAAPQDTGGKFKGGGNVWEKT